jgi:hypothetical protein
MIKTQGMELLQARQSIVKLERALLDLTAVV